MQPDPKMVADILAHFAGLNSAKLARGMHRRQQMLEEIQIGLKPEGSRANWLRASTKRVAELLANLAEEFNEENPDDRCSTADLLDVLSTTKNALEKVAKK